MLDLRKIIPNDTGVRFNSSVEMGEMLQMCDKLHIIWGDEVTATNHKPCGEDRNYIRIDDNGKLYYGSIDSVPHMYCKRLVEWRLLKHDLDNSPIFNY